MNNLNKFAAFLLMGLLASCGDSKNENTETADSVKTDTVSTETSTQQENASSENMNPTELTDVQVRNLFVELVNTEDYIRGYDIQDELSTTGEPCTPLRKEVNSLDALRSFLGQSYSRNAIDEFIKIAGICDLPNGKIGRNALFTYSKSVSVDAPENILLTRVTEEPKKHVFEVQFLSAKGEKQKIKEFVVVFEGGNWKSDNVFAQIMKTAEKSE